MPRVGKYLNKKSAIYLIVVAIIIIIVFAFFYKKHQNAVNNSTAHQSPAQAQISSFRNAKTLTDKRTLAAAYEDSGQYNQSKAVWQDIADQTHQTLDYWSLLNICASYHVNGRSSCINSTAGILKNRTNQMNFQTAYTIGELLESTGNPKLSIPFYQRALSNYNPPNDSGANFPTKEQLQEKINGLNA